MKKPIEYCSACGRPLVTYKRTITAAMAVALLLLYRKGEGKWAHLPTLKLSVSNPQLRAALGGGDVSKMRFWGLIEMLDGIRPDGSSRVGYYRITPKGEEFCRDEARVAKYVIIRCGGVQGFAGQQIGIRDALREKFNYSDLLTV